MYLHHFSELELSVKYSMTKEELLEGIERMLCEIDDEETLEEIYNYVVELLETEKSNGQ